MDKNFRIESERFLAVEGKDECNFFKALLKHIGINNIQLLDIGGKDRFPLEFPALYNQEGFNKIKRLGFIRDAETNPAQSAFESVCHIIKTHNLSVPDNANEIKRTNIPHIGIFIMPDNKGTGMLENLCLETIKSMPQFSCIESYISCIAPSLSPSEKEIFNEQKARVQTYLASRSPIVNSLGLGAQKGYWDFNHHCLDDIKYFLRELFNS